MTLQAENEELRRRLDEAEETIRAIQQGTVDAFVVNEPTGQRVYTLDSADRPYRLLVEQMQQGAATLQADGTIVYCNQRLADLLNVPHERLVGAPLHDFFAPDDRPQYENLLWQGLTRIGRGEARLRRPDGSLIPVYLTFNVLPSDCGAITGVLVTDLTSQRHHEQLSAAHQALVESEQRFRRMADAVPVLIWVSDVTKACTWFNQWWLDFSGRPMAELVGDGWAVDVHPDDLDRCLDIYVTHFDARLPFSMEYRLKRHDGEYRWVLDNGVPRVDAAGEFAGYIGSCVDFTDRKIAEQAVQDSEARFRMIADNMAQLAWTCDALGNVTWYNRRWLEYTGLSFAEAKGWDWGKVQHPDHLDRVMKRLRRSAETGESWEDTFPMRGKDGQYRWFLSRALPIRGDNGEIVCWFGTNTDITEQRQSREALQDADRMKDEFLATLAHELRGPLAPLRNMLEIMKRADGNEELLRRARDTMERQLGQLVRLVDDLLEVSRISRGRIELKEELVELSPVINQAVEACPVAEFAEHAVTVSLPEEPIYLFADPARLAQIFGNLLNNACKYTEPGGKIWITAVRDGSDVVVRVKDTGVGIPPDDLDSVFEMFVQVDRSLGRSKGGLGIGLTLVKRLVEMHGGTVDAFSDGADQGSEFVVRLPILVEKPAASMSSPATDVQAPMAARRILIVDDNVDTATSLAMLLKMTGHQTHTASDGLEAVEEAERFRPDVVLLDIGLPKLNGYAAARRIREQSWGNEMVLVAVTGWGQEADRQKSQAAGFDHHLVKPVNYAELIELLGV